MPTIVDVAREAGVSTAAVSLVLNNPHTTRVGEARRKEILKVAEKLGYAPNALAKALIQRKTRILGLVVPLRDPIFFNHFIAQVLAGIQSCLIERDYHLMVFSHSARSGKITRRQILQSRFVDGLIFFNTRMCSAADMTATIQELRSAGVPFVMVNAYYGHEPINYVGFDDGQIGYIAGAFLAQRGHRRIAHLGGAHRSPMREPLLEGFRKALAAHGLSVDPKLVAYGELEKETTRAATLELLRRKNPPSAIFSSDDQMVPEVYETIRGLGMRIPQDVAVLSRGDLYFAPYLSPKLTTVRVPTFEMGRRAAELLVDSLAAPDRPSQRILLPTELIERESA